MNNTVWWKMRVGKATREEASGKHNANTANVKTYIDFAAANGVGRRLGRLVWQLERKRA